MISTIACCRYALRFPSAGDSGATPDLTTMPRRLHLGLDCKPSSEVEPSPEAVDLGESTVSQHFLVPACCHWDESTLQRKAFTFDLFHRVTIAHLIIEIMTDKLIVEDGTVSEYLFDKDHCPARNQRFIGRLDQALPILHRDELQGQKRENERYPIVEWG